MRRPLRLILAGLALLVLLPDGQSPLLKLLHGIVHVQALDESSCAVSNVVVL